MASQPFLDASSYTENGFWKNVMDTRLPSMQASNLWSVQDTINEKLHNGETAEEIQKELLEDIPGINLNLFKFK